MFDIYIHLQISTQEEDFLVDTIALHDVMSILRPVFSNPDICKVIIYRGSLLESILFDCFRFL